MAGHKKLEVFIGDFYENQLTRVLDQDAQLLFFQTSPGSHWHTQLALTMLSRKFHLGPEMAAASKAMTPLQIHLQLLEDLFKIPKSKFNPKRGSDTLMLVLAISTAKMFVCKALSSFGNPTASLVTETDLATLKEFVEPYLNNAGKNWNPFLIPYRLMFGKPLRSALTENQKQPDVEVVIVAESTARTSPRSKTQRTK